MRNTPTFKAVVAALGIVAGAATAVGAQTPAFDPSDRLREVLPADVADRVIARIAEARARELPAAALENRALKFASRGIEARDIERAINDHAARMDAARRLIRDARGPRVDGDEIEAGAEAMRQGVDGAVVSELAKSAPSGRSLAVPLLVIGTLVERGLPGDEALARVRDRLEARASDADLERVPGEMGRGRPTAPGTGVTPPQRPTNPGRPEVVPVRPVTPPTPPTRRP